MVTGNPSITQLAQIISSVTAPAFLLAAVGSFSSVTITRMNRVIDRSQALNSIGDNESSRVHLKTDVPRLKRRAELLNSAIMLLTISGAVTGLLIVAAFGCAFLQVQHEYGIAALFVVACVFFVAALVNLARETRMSLHEYDHYK